MAAVQLLRLGPGALEVPVQVVELELAELHVFPIGVQEALDQAFRVMGSGAGVIVMPYGGSTLPVLSGDGNTETDGRKD